MIKLRALSTENLKFKSANQPEASQEVRVGVGVVAWKENDQGLVEINVLNPPLSSQLARLTVLLSEKKRTK